MTTRPTLQIVRTTREEQAARRARLAEQRRPRTEYSERVKHAAFLTIHGLLAEMGNGVESDWDSRTWRVSGR